MSAWQVKTEAGNRTVEDIEALRALVVTGEVVADTKVRKGTRGRWKLAGDVPELVDIWPSDAGDEDPWAAWDDELDDLGEDVRDEVTSGADDNTEEIPASTVDILDDDDSVEVSVDDLVAEPPKLKGEKRSKKRKKKVKKPATPPEVGDRKEPKFVVDSDADGPIPEVAPAHVASAQPDERGKVITFPEGGRRRTRPLQTSAQPAAQRDCDPRSQTRRRPETSPLDGVQGRYFGYLFFFGISCLGVGLGVWYIWSVATWSSSDPLGHSLGAEPPKTIAEAPVEPVASKPFVEPKGEGDVLQPILDDLKATMVHDIVEIPPNDITPLEDALFLELMKLVNVKGLDVEVLSWSKKGAPVQVSFDIQVRSGGDPQRELGAVALVVGKYIDHYDFLVRRFEVTRVDEEAGTAGTYRLDAKRASRLYTDDIGLMRALDGI